MSFENVKIVFDYGTGAYPNTTTFWEQQWQYSGPLFAKLSDTRGVYSYRWELLGKPSNAKDAGTGNEIIQLGSGATATITPDYVRAIGTGTRNLYDWNQDGGYVIRCTVNLGSPNEAAITGLMTINTLFETTSYTGQPLREIAAREALDDQSTTWLTTLGNTTGYTNPQNAWLHWISDWTMALGQLGGPSWPNYVIEPSSVYNPDGAVQPDRVYQIGSMTSTPSPIVSCGSAGVLYAVPFLVCRANVIDSIVTAFDYTGAGAPTFYWGIYSADWRTCYPDMAMWTSAETAIPAGANTMWLTLGDTGQGQLFAPGMYWFASYYSDVTNLKMPGLELANSAPPVLGTAWDLASPALGAAVSHPLTVGPLPPTFPLATPTILTGQTGGGPTIPTAYLRWGLPNLPH